MTPFPEVELVTIERLEVALRNGNEKLLKEGSYKLHEKYHSGYKFEYLDKLRNILIAVKNNTSVPNDIKEILCPTIEDILAESEENYTPQSRVSSLTQLSYNAGDKNASATAVEETERQEKISAFDVFSPSKEEIASKENRSYSQSPFQSESSVPFQEFKMPETSIKTQQSENELKINSFENHELQQPQQTQQTIFQENNSEITLENLENNEQYSTPKELKEVSIFYCQDVSNEKIKNILRYRELVSKFEYEHNSLNEILHLISEINVQSNTNIMELKNILDQLQISKNNVNLITNSSSANLIGLMEQMEYSYSLYERKEDKQIALMPVFGLSNQFVCPTCHETYLDKEDKINPLVIQCPKCKNPMFPDFYAAMNGNLQMNLDYYNNALLSLANSKVWVVIHPVTEDKIMVNLIQSALKLNPLIDEIYILDKDINVREEFKNRFLAIRNGLNINTNMSALEDFLNSIK